MSILYSHIEAVNKCGYNTGFLSRKFPISVAWLISFLQLNIIQLNVNFFFFGFVLLLFALPLLLPFLQPTFFFSSFLCYFLLHCIPSFLSSYRDKKKNSWLWCGFFFSQPSIFPSELQKCHLLFKNIIVLPSCGKLRYLASQINAQFTIVETPENAQSCS